MGDKRGNLVLYEWSCRGMVAVVGGGKVGDDGCLLSGLDVGHGGRRGGGEGIVL